MAFYFATRKRLQKKIHTDFMIYDGIHHKLYMYVPAISILYCRLEKKVNSLIARSKIHSLAARRQEVAKYEEFHILLC